jgi:hypothetical protein
VPVELALIDAIGPFFRGLDQRRINWSKIPFPHLFTSGPERAGQWSRIREDFATLAGKVAAAGYNAVTLDDLAHLVDHPWFEHELRERNAVFRAEFGKLFAIAHAHGLQVFITSDYLTTSAAVDAHLRGKAAASRAWFVQLIDSFFAEFPDTAGIILRIGESDGHDVADPLRSRLALQTTRELRLLLRDILPAFEKRGRRLIFRTWTVGAHLIGDLIWHRERLAQAFAGIHSPALVISMKYGESDFFRYLPLNRHFFRVELPTIVEFQARREYEGAGEYPSFVGWDVEQYARDLRGAKQLIGFSVWCQTGGWHGFRRLAFLQPEAMWIELNAIAIARIMQHGDSVERVVFAMVGERRSADAIEFLRYTDTAVRQILYIEEFARQKLFFRRVRIPPLLHVFWDCIFFNDGSRKMLAHLVRDPEDAIRSGEAAFGNFDRMLALAGKLDWPVEDIEFMRDTFRILLLARRYYFQPPDAAFEAEILAAKAAYKLRWPRPYRQRYRLRTSFAPLPVKVRTLRWLIALVVRRQRGYRPVLDHLFTLRVLSWTYRLFRRRRERLLPKLARETAMGVDALFR